MYNIGTKIIEAKIETVALIESHQTPEEVRALLEASGTKILGITEKNDPRGYGFIVLNKVEIPN